METAAVSTHTVVRRTHTVAEGARLALENAKVSSFDALWCTHCLHLLSCRCFVVDTV
jgi:hypothetical protein